MIKGLPTTVGLWHKATPLPTLRPLSQLALLQNESPPQLHARLEEFLIFGTIPKTLSLTARSDKVKYLTETVTSRLLQTMLASETVRAPEVVVNLLKLLAFHVGREQSVGELALQVGVDGKTVSRYLGLLEQAGIILRLNGFGRSLPSEITRKSRYYFLDNGIRNGLLSQFNQLELRSDAEALWENFVIVERFKKQAYYQTSVRRYFWRIYSGQQLELVEEIDGQLHGYGFKLSTHKTPRTPKAWFSTYPEAHYHVVNLDNYQEFIT